MTTDRAKQLWEGLEDLEYRREFSADVGTGLAFQIRMLRESRGWTQERLANLTGKQQETISQWENPNYGSYTLNSLKSLAAAFDVALIVRFAPFSELIDWSVNLTPARLSPPSFEEERAQSIQRLLAAHSITLPSHGWIARSSDDHGPESFTERLTTEPAVAATIREPSGNKFLSAATSVGDFASVA